jgi:prepilin peptidase CpaA
MSNILVSIVVIAIGLVACVFDIRTRRIPNALTLGAALAGLVFHLATSGLAGAQMALTGWFIGGALLVPFFALGGMGGGDVKLVAALGAWLGWSHAFWLAMYAGIAGGVLGLFVAVSHGYLRQAVVNIGGMFRFWSIFGPQSVPGMTLESSAAPRLAYAIPILVGTMVTLWL